ncbi:hypothetical protein [Streptomyces sp. NPDC002851]
MEPHRATEPGERAAVAPGGYATQKECAVTQDNSKSEQRGPKEPGDPKRQPKDLGSLDVWAKSAPIRLAGYEDDLAEPHILQSVD